MFNFLKVFLTFSFFKYHKRNISIILVAIILMIITVFVTSDIIKIVPKDDKLGVFFIKWFLLFILLIITFFNFYRMFKSKTIKEEVKKKEEVKVKREKPSNKVDKEHKKRILSDNNIESKGEQIINKYRKDDN